MPALQEDRRLSRTGFQRGRHSPAFPLSHQIAGLRQRDEAGATNLVSLEAQICRRNGRNPGIEKERHDLCPLAPARDPVHRQQSPGLNLQTDLLGDLTPSSIPQGFIHLTHTARNIPGALVGRLNDQEPVVPVEDQAVGSNALRRQPCSEVLSGRGHARESTTLSPQRIADRAAMDYCSHRDRADASFVRDINFYRHGPRSTPVMGQYVDVDQTRRDAVSVRDVRSADLEAVADLAAESVDWHAATFPDVPSHTERRDFITGYRDFAATADTYFRVAETNGSVVGFLTAQLSTVREPAHSDQMRSVWIADIVVTRQARRRGIARSLLHDLDEWASRSNAAEITLRMHAGNTAAQQLYESEGFQPNWITYRKQISPPR